MYVLTSEPENQLVNIKLKGFWDEKMAAAFGGDLARAVGEIHQSSPSHIVLVDIREFRIQSQEVVVALRDLVRQAPVKARKIAVIAGDGLARIQYDRVADRDDMRLFANRDDARRWLFAETGSPRRYEPQVDAFRPPAPESP